LNDGIYQIPDGVMDVNQATKHASWIFEIKLARLQARVLEIERESIRSHSCWKLSLEEATDLSQDVQQNDDDYCTLGDKVQDMFFLSIIYMITSLITFNANEYNKLRIHFYGCKIHL
jgi:hypothetical protein